MRKWITRHANVSSVHSLFDKEVFIQAPDFDRPGNPNTNPVLDH
ncbi:hypothetical protein AGR7A_Lc120655 [Agrobacterium deltaense NCPPB 1641]|uniref:Uncharacterized protein n=1 Tax=Agrobacterium deltaense NCPPB 1641 TaxID=1183425 RepID=A0A1S7TYP8_9HYPH|nr:hypothetical protein AGR7A_Lc120655 [Agrobacterium deltaense NCPPB 1641]